MRYIVTLPPAEPGAALETMAGPGEPVVPWFPAPVKNLFVAIPSFKFASQAVVMEIDIDPDAIVDRLKAQYPGLPVAMHENYVMAMALLAAQLRPGDRVRPIITQDSACVQVINTNLLIQLWDTQPLKGKLCRLEILNR